MSPSGWTFCHYITPCGYCVRLDKECPERGKKKFCRKATAVMSAETNEKLLNPAGEYAAEFAKNHGISIAAAMEEPMVKARFEYFNKTGY